MGSKFYRNFYISIFLISFIIVSLFAINRYYEVKNLKIELGISYRETIDNATSELNILKTLLQETELNEKMINLQLGQLLMIKQELDLINASLNLAALSIYLLEDHIDLMYKGLKQNDKQSIESFKSAALNDVNFLLELSNQIINRIDSNNPEEWYNTLSDEQSEINKTIKDLFREYELNSY